jgi:hypothetical protein
MGPESPRRQLTTRRLRLGAIVAVGLAVAFVVWLLVRGDGGEGTTSTTTATGPAARHNVVVRATVQRLKKLARLVDHPIYWAGPRRGTKYELTQSANGRIYIRYLPLKVPIGDRRGRYLIVATYPLPDAYKAVQTAAKEQGGHAIALEPRGLAVYNDDAPSNVYFALPGSKYQVEVYHPDAAQARRLVTSGRIRPIQ